MVDWNPRFWFCFRICLHSVLLFCRFTWLTGKFLLIFSVEFVLWIAVCPTSCFANTCFESSPPSGDQPDLQCCDRQCIGACTGSGPSRCVACVNVFHNGICLPSCPPDTYEVCNTRFFQAILLLRMMKNFSDDLLLKIASSVMNLKQYFKILSCKIVLKSHVVASLMSLFT